MALLCPRNGPSCRGGRAVRLSYDTSCFKISTDAAGNNVVLPDTTTFAASTGGTQLYLWGVGASDPSGAKIALEYVEGDPEVENVAKTTAPAVVVPTGGKDVTQALFFGGCRVYEALERSPIISKLRSVTIC